MFSLNSVSMKLLKCLPLKLPPFTKLITSFKELFMHFLFETEILLFKFLEHYSHVLVVLFVQNGNLATTYSNNV